MVLMIAASDQLSNRLLPRSVRRAVDAMRADLGHTRTVTELAAVAGVSSRTLQRQFLAFVRKTPRGTPDFLWPVSRDWPVTSCWARSGDRARRRAWSFDLSTTHRAVSS